MASERTALECLDHEGFIEHFMVQGGVLHGIEGGEAFRPDQVVIRKLARFEGVSDPDDMSIVYAIEGWDGTRGTLVDAFGVYADPAVGTFVNAVPPPCYSAASR